MPNIWLSENFFSNKKIKRLELELGGAGIVALQKLWIYAAKYAIDNLLDENKVGILKNFDAIDIEIIAEWKGKRGDLEKALKKQKLIHKIKGDYYIHDFVDNNPYIPVYINKKLGGSGYAARRKDRQPKGDPQGDPKVTPYKRNVSKRNVTKENIKEEEKEDKKALPDSYKNMADGFEYEKYSTFTHYVITYLNKKADKHFMCTKAAITLIGKLREGGHPESSFYKAIDNTVTAFKHTAYDSGTLNIDKLFGDDIKFQKWVNWTQKKKKERNLDF